MIMYQGGREIFVIREGGGYEKLLPEGRTRKSKIKGEVSYFLRIIVYAEVVVLYVCKQKIDFLKKD